MNACDQTPRTHARTHLIAIPSPRTVAVHDCGQGSTARDREKVWRNRVRLLNDGRNYHSRCLPLKPDEGFDEGDTTCLSLEMNTVSPNMLSYENEHPTRYCRPLPKVWRADLQNVPCQVVHSNIPSCTAEDPGRPREVVAARTPSG